MLLALLVSSISVGNISPRAPQCEINTTLVNSVPLLKLCVSAPVKQVYMCNTDATKAIPPQVPLCERAVSVVIIPNLLFDSDDHDIDHELPVPVKFSANSDCHYVEETSSAVFGITMYSDYDDRAYVEASDHSVDENELTQGGFTQSMSDHKVVNANDAEGVNADVCNDEFDVASKQSHTVRDQGVISDVTTNHDGGTTDDSTSKCDHGIDVNLYSLLKDVLPYSPVQHEDPRGVLPAQCDSDQGDAGIMQFQPAGLSGEVQCNGPGEPPVNGQGVLLSAACDADWGGRIDDSKSTTGLSLSLNDVCVHAKSKVQNRPALSTAEAECNAVEAVLKEIEWYRGLLMELNISITKPVVVFQDNQTAIRLSNDCIAHQRTKYFRISQHYIRWCVANGYATLDYLQTNKMWCDALTKAVPFPALSTHLPRIMGPQTPLKVFPILVARCKTMFRRRPPKTPLAARLASLQLESKILSRSTHSPPLEAKCLCCNFYLEWSDAMNSWRKCSTPDCLEIYLIDVKCTVCQQDASFNAKLDLWYCLCSFGERSQRQRNPTNRYGHG